MIVKQFFLLSPHDQSLHFSEFKKEIKRIAKKCLWTQFQKRINDVLVEECVSFILEKLVIHHSKIEDDKATSFVYSIAKRFFQEWFYEKHRNANTIFLSDLLLNDKSDDTNKYLKFEEQNGDSELTELKTETVLKFHELIRKINDKNALLIISAFIECVLTQDNYNSQVTSLFLYRKTKLSFDSIYSTLKRLNLKLSLSRPEYFHKIFKMYKEIEANDLNGGQGIISDWEKCAIFHFENHHDRFKSENFAARHNRVQRRPSIKSTPAERIAWIRFNPNNRNLEHDYYEKFGMSYRTYKSDKRMAHN